MHAGKAAPSQPAHLHRSLLDGAVGLVTKVVHLSGRAEAPAAERDKSDDPPAACKVGPGQTHPGRTPSSKQGALVTYAAHWASPRGMPRGCPPKRAPRPPANPTHAHLRPDGHARVVHNHLDGPRRHVGACRAGGRAGKRGRGRLRRGAGRLPAGVPFVAPHFACCPGSAAGPPALLSPCCHALRPHQLAVPLPLLSPDSAFIKNWAVSPGFTGEGSRLALPTLKVVGPEAQSVHAARAMPAAARSSSRRPAAAVPLSWRRLQAGWRAVSGDFRGCAVSPC